MAEQFYSAEEAAEILGLQVRTVRNYVREGRLPGTKIGKQYRIARADLEAFTGASLTQPEPAPAPVGRRHIEVSVVIHVDGVDPRGADRIVGAISGMFASRLEGRGTLHVDPIYDEPRQRLRVVVVGQPNDTVELIRVIDALVVGEVEPGPAGGAFRAWRAN